MRRLVAALVVLVGCAHGAATRGLEGTTCQSDRDCTFGLVCRAAADQKSRACAYETYGECSKDADCFPGRTCRKGQCTVQCVTNASCPKNHRCEVGECVVVDGKPPCLLPGDCPPGEECLAGECKPSPRIECLRDFDCGPLERCVAGVCR